MKKSQEQELDDLRAKVAELENERAASANSSEKYFKEIQDLKKARATNLNNVFIKSIQGDKHISLWHVSGHNIGKRVGPIHPAAAEDTFIMFANAGIKLSMNRPTEEFIEGYKKTKEYKEADAIEAKRRAAKNRSRKSSEIERLTEAIAKSQGVDPAQVNRIKSQDEVVVR